MTDDVRTVVDAALLVRGRAYAKYSGFLVGAALLAADGKIYGGCNVENVSYGLTICAERAAVFNAAAAGQRQFQLLAIASAGGVTPCGACRQVLAEFAPDLPILLVDIDRPSEFAQVSLGELLPGAFNFAQAGAEKEKQRISRMTRKGRSKK